MWPVVGLFLYVIVGRFKGKTGRPFLKLNYLFTAAILIGNCRVVSAGYLQPHQTILSGIAPRKSRLPTSTPQ